MSSQGKYKVEKKDPLRPLLPIIGIIILIIAGTVGWFSSPILIEWVADVPVVQIPAALENDPEMFRILVSVAIFFVIVAVFSTIYALFAPKPEKLVSESSLKQERLAIEQERKRSKLRKRKMRARMKEGTKKMDEI